MAARTLRPRHQDDIRQKIQASQLVNRLQDDALGKIELTQGQRKSIEILLKKSIPDLSSMELIADVEVSDVTGHSTAEIDARLNELEAKLKAHE